MPDQPETPQNLSTFAKKIIWPLTWQVALIASPLGIGAFLIRKQLSGKNSTAADFNNKAAPATAITPAPELTVSESSKPAVASAAEIQPPAITGGPKKTLSEVYEIACTGLREAPKEFFAPLAKVINKLTGRTPSP